MNAEGGSAGSAPRVDLIEAKDGRMEGVGCQHSIISLSTAEFEIAREYTKPGRIKNESKDGRWTYL